MSPGSLHHVGLTVVDLERSIHFYRDLLGLAVRERDDVVGGQYETVTGVVGSQVRIADLALQDGRTLELTQYLAPAGNPVHPHQYDAGHTHVGIEVDDVDGIYRRLIDAGVVTRSRPIELVDAGPFWTGAKVFHAVDPDGITVELVEVP